MFDVTLYVGCSPDSSIDESFKEVPCQEEGLQYCFDMDPISPCVFEQLWAQVRRGSG